MRSDTKDDGGVDRCGPDRIDVGDEVRFEYGKRCGTSRKEVTEVHDRKVRVRGGGFVYYRDIKEINPLEDTGGDSRE